MHEPLIRIGAVRTTQGSVSRVKKLVCAAALAMAVSGAAGQDALDTIEYSGRVSVAGQPFTGKGNFKFVLLQKDGTRLWTNNDNDPPIEDGVPSGSVTLAVRDGIYRVRLGDPAAGMKMLPKTLEGSRQVSQVGTWFDDGLHGWSFLGYASLGSSANQLPATISSYPPGADMAQVMAELRALRTEVAEVRRLMAGPKERPTPAVSLATSQAVARPMIVALKESVRHSLGKPDAPVVLVEFTDYECPFCKRFFEQTFPLLKRDYIDTGKLRFVSRTMPVASHPHALPAALALLGAAERTDDDYWKMRGWLFNNQQALGPTAWARYADEAGLDHPKLLADIASGKHSGEIQEDMAAAQTVGITGTPSFVLGTSDGQIIRGERIVGAKAFAYFESKIRALMANTGGAAAPAQPTSR